MTVRDRVNIIVSPLSLLINTIQISPRQLLIIGLYYLVLANPQVRGIASLFLGYNLITIAFKLIFADISKMFRDFVSAYDLLTPALMVREYVKVSGGSVGYATYLTNINWNNANKVCTQSATFQCIDPQCQDPTNCQNACASAQNTCASYCGSTTTYCLNEYSVCTKIDSAVKCTAKPDCNPFAYYWVDNDSTTCPSLTSQRRYYPWCPLVWQSATTCIKINR
jgi:hypothetical protein